MPEVVRFPRTKRVQERQWALMKAFTEARRGTLKPYRPQKDRFTQIDEEEDQGIASFVEFFIRPKVSTQRQVRSLTEGYRQACATRAPARRMFPLTAKKVGHWWMRK